MVLNYIWIAFFLLAFVIALCKLIFLGDTTVFPAIMNSTFAQAKTAFEISLGLTGVLSLWMGVMKIGERGGLVAALARFLSPVLCRIFPDIPKGHPVMGTMFMNFSANMLGLDNAATPMGLKAMQELQVCMDAVHEIIELTNAALRQNDLACARTVEPLEETIDRLTKALKDNHIQRLQAGQCTLALGFIYNDAINNFERISDHCSNIAVAVLEANDAHLLPHAYLHALEETGEAGYRSQLAVYQEKYLSPLTPTEV